MDFALDLPEGMAPDLILVAACQWCTSQARAHGRYWAEPSPKLASWQGKVSPNLFRCGVRVYCPHWPIHTGPHEKCLREEWLSALAPFCMDWHKLFLKSPRG